MIKLTEQSDFNCCERSIGNIENYLKPKIDRISDLADRIETAIKKNRDMLDSESDSEINRRDDEDFETPWESTIFKVNDVLNNASEKLNEIEDELFDTLMALKKL